MPLSGYSKITVNVFQRIVRGFYYWTWRTSHYVPKGVSCSDSTRLFTVVWCVCRSVNDVKAEILYSECQTDSACQTTQKRRGVITSWLLMIDELWPLFVRSPILYSRGPLDSCVRLLLLLILTMSRCQSRHGSKTFQSQQVVKVL